MTEHNDALAMTEEERKQMDKAVRFIRDIIETSRRDGVRIPLTNTQYSLVRAAEHIEALNVRNLNFGNAYRELEARVTAVAAAAWNQGYQRGLDVHYDNEDPDAARNENPYTQTHSTEEN